MSRLRRLIAVALLALWLPATLHCALGEAGFDSLFACIDTSSCCDHEAPPRDSCDLVETGAFKPAANTAVLAAPVLSACLLSFVVPVSALDLTPPPSALSERIIAPPEVARTWHFAARAALPSRAPSLS